MRETIESAPGRLGIALAMAALIAMLLAAAMPSDAAAAPDKRTCGVLPGDGYYSYVKTRNVPCREARRVGRKAGRKFCKTASNCDAMPTDKPDKGRVRAKGWSCKMKVGWEFFQARCEKGNMSFLQRSAA